MANELICIISARRPNSVSKMKLFAPQARWYVAVGEAEAYREAGALDVVEVGGLIDARNRALEDAFAEGRACVQLSDDLKKLQEVTDDLKTFDITLEQAVNVMGQICDVTGAKLAGVAPVANTFYYSPKSAVKTHHFIVGDMIYVKPSKPRFDNTLQLKEDYDFTAQHIQMYDSVARCDFIFATFVHRTNAGGAVAYRTPEIEQQSIARLIEKWGSAIRLNPRRENEILFNGKKVKRG